MGQRLNIRDFLTVQQRQQLDAGETVIECRAAFQAAIAMCKEVGAEAVYVPPGNYDLG